MRGSDPKDRISSDLEIQARYGRRYATAIRSVAGYLPKWLVPAGDEDWNFRGMCSRAAHWACDFNLAAGVSHLGCVSVGARSSCSIGPHLEQSHRSGLSVCSSARLGSVIDKHLDNTSKSSTVKPTRCIMATNLPS